MILEILKTLGILGILILAVGFHGVLREWIRKLR